MAFAAKPTVPIPEVVIETMLVSDATDVITLRDVSDVSDANLCPIRGALHMQIRGKALAKSGFEGNNRKCYPMTICGSDLRWRTSLDLSRLE